jgi:hypothetical protein
MLRALEQPRKRSPAGQRWIFRFSRVCRWYLVAVQLLRSFRPAVVGQREVGATWGMANLGTMLEKEFRYV